MLAFKAFIKKAK